MSLPSGTRLGPYEIHSSVVRIFGTITKGSTRFERCAMRQTIVALVIVLSIPTVAFGQDQPSRVNAAVNQSSHNRATAQPLADSASRLAIVAAAAQEPQTPAPQKKMHSMPMLVAGVVTAAATAVLITWIATCDDDIESCSHMQHSNESLVYPLLMGAQRQRA